MRLPIRSTLFDGRSYASTPVGELGKVPRGEAGARSDSWYADILGGGPDVNPELTGSLKFPIFDEMALTDPTIKGILQFWALTCRSGLWGCEPRNDSPDAKAISDMVAWNVGLNGNLGQMDLSWEGSLGLSITTGLKMGPSIEELVWGSPDSKDGTKEWRDADGDAHLVVPLGQLAPRPAYTIGKVKRERGRVVSIDQVIPGTQPMPADKLCYVVFDPDETGRWEGSSMIRPAWVAWRMKKALQIAAGIGWDRFASGLPVIFHPDNEDAERRARSIAEAIRQHERAFVNFPSNGPGQNGRPDSEWFLELVNGAQTLADPVPLLRYFTDQEVEAGLAQWSALGRDKGGSRALGEVQIDPFFLGVSAVAKLMARERERQVFYRITEVNFGREAAETMTPKLTVSKIQARSIEVIARALSYLAPAGITFTDAGAVEDIREMLGFGQLDAAADAIGISKENLLAVFRDVGLDANTVAAIVNALPPELGVAANRVEGAPLGLPSGQRPALGA